MGLLAGRTAVITGGAQGLGLAIARVFIDEGAQVVLGDLNLDDTEAVARHLGGPSKAVAVRCDVRSAEQVDALAAAAVDQFETLDIMVNNAGITRDATLRKMTEEQFDEVIAVHLKGTWNGTKAASAIMREQGGGAIINMSSISGKVGLIGQTNYSAAKAGMHGFTKALAQEVARKGVTVNTVSPGYLATKMVTAVPPDVLQQIVAGIPVGRLGQPAEIAALVSFIASEAAAFMTGSNVSMNGGQYMA